MPRTVESTVFQFDELSDTAKEHARDWWRSCESQDWHDSEYILDDAKAIAEILGIEFNTRQVPLMNGSTRPEPNIYWSGFWSQGDGACFEGSYAYKAGSCKAIRAYAPTDKTLHEIADNLRDIQRKYFYQLRATCRHSGRYQHSGCMSVDVEHADDCWRDIGDAEDDIQDELRNFADWIYSQLETAYFYSMSEKNVDENIRANEYEFDENGTIH